MPRSLLSLLLNLEVEKLKDIAHWWCVDLPNGSRSEQATTLAREILRSDTSLYMYWERIGPESRDLLLRIAEHSELRLSQLAISKDDPALRGLLTSGIVWMLSEADLRSERVYKRTPSSDPYLLIPRELTRMITRLKRKLQEGDTSDKPLEFYLESMGTGELETVALHWGLADEPGSYTREEIIKYLLEELGKTPTSRVLKKLTTNALMVYRSLLEEGKAYGFELTKSLNLSLSAMREAIIELTENILVQEALYNDRWLIFPTRGLIHTTKSKNYVSPPEVYTPRKQVKNPDYAPAWDMLHLLRAYQLYDLPYPNNAEIEEALFNRLASLIFTSSKDKASHAKLLFHLSSDLGLISENAGMITTTQAVESWVKLPIEVQAKRIFKAWIETKYDESHGLLKQAPGYSDSQELLKKARLEIIEILSACHVDKWYSIEQVSEIIRQEHPYIIRTNNRLVRELGLEGAQKALEEWPRYEGRWITLLFQGPLTWLHVVETSSDELNPVFSLTPDGAFLIGKSKTKYESKLAKSLSIQSHNSGLQIRVPRPESSLIWTLSAFARPHKWHESGLGIYVADRRTVARARGVNLSPSGIVDFLEEHSKEKLPNSITSKLEEWGKEPYKVSFAQGLVLTLDSTEAVRDLQKLSFIQHFHPMIIGETKVLLLLPKDNYEREVSNLLRRLNKTGLFFVENNHGG